MKCVCGKQLKYIAGSDGCGDLRCISCLRSSGYCSSVSEAIREYKRKHNHDPFEEC